MSLLGGIDWGACWSGFWGAVSVGLANTLTGFIDYLTSFGFVFITPQGLTYHHAVVINLWKWSLGVADAALALFLVVGGYNALMSHTLGANFHGVLEFLPRLLLALVAANFSFVFISSFIDLNNALCIAVQLALAGVSKPQQLIGLVINIATLQGVAPIAYLIELVVSLLIAVEMLVRIALLDLLTVLSPIWLLMLGLKQTERFGRLGAVAFSTTLFLQFLQVLTMGLGSALAASFGPINLSPVGILVGVATLYLTFKLPGMLYGSVLRGVESRGSDVATVAARLGGLLLAR